MAIMNFGKQALIEYCEWRSSECRHYLPIPVLPFLCMMNSSNDVDIPSLIVVQSSFHFPQAFERICRVWYCWRLTSWRVLLAMNRSTEIIDNIKAEHSTL
jgi:hypothetical protein